MNNEMISIIVPVYNLEKELPRCVESIQAQTYKNIEIILVDDGSNDSSGTVIQTLAESDCRIVPIYKKNGGVTSARLAGIRQASGEWIGFVDGDDEIEPNMYEQLLKNMLEYQADISHCGYQMVFVDGRIHYFHNTGCLIVQDKIKGLQDLLDGSFVEPGLCNKLFHKSLFCSLLQSDLMDVNLRENEDLLMNYYLFKEAKVSVFQDFCPYHYIVREGSATRQKTNTYKIFDPIKVKIIIFDNCDDDLKEKAGCAVLNTCVNVYSSLVQEKNDVMMEKKQIRQYICKYHHFHKFMKKRRKFLECMIVYTPLMFSILYPVYAKYIQKKQYN